MVRGKLGPWVGPVMNPVCSVKRRRPLRPSCWLPWAAVLLVLLAGLAIPAAAAPDDHAAIDRPSSPGAASTIDPGLVGALRSLLGDAGALTNLPAVEPSRLQAFYGGRDYAPLWVAGVGLLPQGTALLQSLDRLARSGAIAPVPAAAALEQRRAATAAASLAELEILLSSALLSLAVDPDDLMAPAAAADVLDAAETADDFSAFLPHWLPPDPAFWRLRSAIAAFPDAVGQMAWPIVNQGSKLAPGSRDGRIPQVRQRLMASGDFSGAAGEADVYDDGLVEAVRRFQTRHGLLPDGVIGFGTVDALNIPAQARLASMILNLRRLYVEARGWGDDYLAVNIPAAQMRLVQDGRITISANVIVGRVDRQTPQIDSAINRLEFNPFWTVPSGVYQKDILPKVRKDPGFLSSHNIRVYRTAEPANEIDPAEIDWFSPEAKQMRLRLRQDPGPENALGPAKFLFPNPYDVYVHGTNKQSLFSHAERFLSSGCVRVPDPLALAAQVLKDNASWPRTRIDEAVRVGKNVGVALEAPLPVHLVYDTAWVDEDGTLQFRRDVYGRDRETVAVATRGNDD